VSPSQGRRQPPQRRRRGADPQQVAKRRKRRGARARTRRRRRIVLWLTLGIVPLLILAVLAVGGTAAFSSSCDLSSLKPVGIGQNSFVYAADGSLLGAIPADRNRTPVSLRQISPWVPKATVAIEDRRFYQHGGVDYEGIFRALLADIRAGKVVQGGSTITQQLVRNLYISKERTVKRKVVEACLAIKLSRHWSKQRILTAYMNQVYYGNHAYGIEAAAETYFSKRADHLTLREAAMLAGLPQAPSLFDPFRQPGAALHRRDQVLRALLTTGDITASEYTRARGDRSLHLRPGRRYTRIREPYFFTYVEELLQHEYGTSTVRSGGLKVYTTIDPRLQRAAQSAIRHVLDERDDPASAIVAVNPRNGAIRAMTAVVPGSRRNQYNFVSQAQRQPGSTFKTIVLATAIAQGIDPDTTDYVSAPFVYNPDPAGTCANRIAWCVDTYDHRYLGVTSLTNATIHSDNTVYARLILDLGPEKVVRMARKLGIRSSPLRPFPSLTLGTIGVTPLELASVYATLAAGGVYSQPMAIKRVVLANGKVDDEAGWGKPRRQRVIPDGVAYAVTKVLEQNMLRGTGTGAHVWNRIDAGKTGTTDQYRDAWFAGYTPQLESTVWIGYPRAEIPMLDVHGIAVSGPTFPAQIWHLFMTDALGRTPAVDFPEPRTEPVWETFHGQYQYSGAPAPETTTTETTSTTGTSTTTNTPSTTDTETATTP
jgi:penicillin-binding protein 1A